VSKCVERIDYTIQPIDLSFLQYKIAETKNVDVEKIFVRFPWHGDAFSHNVVRPPADLRGGPNVRTGTSSGYAPKLILDYSSFNSRAFSNNYLV
jgi:hypothetical protein